MAARASGAVDEAVAAAAVNEVRLVGRLAAQPASRVLPSGTPMTAFRLVVSRGAGTRSARDGGGRAPTVDTIDCVAWSARIRSRLERLAGGETLEVEGALRRRFWRTGGGAPASRSEVEVVRLKRVRDGQA